ncbi:hypothetical protein [Gordonia prachuapensis]
MTQHRIPRRRNRRLRLTLVLLLSVTTLLGATVATSQAQPALAGHDGLIEFAPDSADLATPAGRIVWDLTTDRHDRAAEHLPAGFAAEFGYRPEVDRGYPINPGGGCSSPVPLPDRFEILCRTHDFGYDVLRFADRSGMRLGGWARLRLDRMLVERMHASCTSPICHIAATAADLGLRLNTWRQFDGPPGSPESAAEIMSSGLGRGWAAFVDRGAEQPR